MLLLFMMMIDLHKRKQANRCRDKITLQKCSRKSKNTTTSSSSSSSISSSFCLPGIWFCGLHWYPE
jgi:hypothetical protein